MERLIVDVNIFLSQVQIHEPCILRWFFPTARTLRSPSFIARVPSKNGKCLLYTDQAKVNLSPIIYRTPVSVFIKSGVFF